MSFLCPLHRLIRVLHGLLRMLVPCLVVFFPVVGSGRPVCVRRELVEFGCSLVRVIWHGVLLGYLTTSVKAAYLKTFCETVQKRTASPSSNP